MDDLVLDADLLYHVADVIGGYCAKQREVVNVYYAQIMALESEWRDDETFGSLVEELTDLKAKALDAIEEVYGLYPKYFRKRAQEVFERPVYNSGDTIINNAPPVMTISGRGAGYGRVSSVGSIVSLGSAVSRGAYSNGSMLSPRNSKAAGTIDSADSISSDGTVCSNNGVSDGNYLNTPRKLSVTQQKWAKGSLGIEIYNTPTETGRELNSNQGVSVEKGGEGVEGFEGTCGLVSVENILRLAGVKVTESEIVEYARTHKTGGIFSRRSLCTVGGKPWENGGTYAQDRQEILKHYGVDSRIERASLESIAQYVGEGRGVIASVDANMLWYGNNASSPAFHAITVTSVQRDSVTNEIYGFYICDSGSGNNDNARFVPAYLMSAALAPSGGSVNVTNSIIR